MIAGFIQVDAFIKAVSELKENCCQNDVLGRNGTTVLYGIWAEITSDLEVRRKEQDNHHKLSMFIKIAQNNLTEFANHTYEFHRQFEPYNSQCGLEIKDCLKEIGMQIVKSLELLFNYYTADFDLNGTIPFWLIYTNNKVIPLHKTMMDQMKVNRIDPELILVLDGYLVCLHQPENHKIRSWRQFFYIQHLAEELAVYMRQPDSNETISLIKFLIGYNFNPLPFYEFFLKYAVTAISPDMPYEDQEMEWLILLKIIENVRLETKDGYNTEVPSILESIAGFIHRELGLIAKKKLIMVPLPLNGKENRRSNYYFSVSTTIEELFFLIRIMLEVSFIKTSYKANLYSFVANHIKTDRSNNPSAQYMRNLFGLNKVIPLKVVKKIRAWLVTMIAYIDAHFLDCLRFWFIGIFTTPYILDFIKF